MDILQHVFSFVCGQNPAHTWTPGGELLPCCQRCTGLYTGAGVAVVLQLALRMRPTARFLQVHGALILLMVPFGFHWIAHGEFVRTLTGLLFGFGAVCFLWLVPGEHVSGMAGQTRRQQMFYAAVMVATLVIVPMLARWGGRSGGLILAIGALGGLVGLGGLVFANLSVPFRWLVAPGAREPPRPAG